MGRIGKYIDRLCQEKPDVMLTVLNVPMTDMADWGYCLVGVIRRVGSLRDQGRGLNFEETSIGLRVSATAGRLGGVRNHTMYGNVIAQVRAGTPRMEALIKARMRRRLYPPVSFRELQARVEELVGV